MNYKLRSSMIFFSVLTGIFSLLSCEKSNKNLAVFSKINDSIKKIYAPDKRVAIFDISIKFLENKLVLEGESDQTLAVDLLKQKLNDLTFLQ